MDVPAQKGFYDTRRQFQGHDSPEGDSSGAQAPDPAPPAGIPRGQVIAGLLFLALIALAFLKFAFPPEIAAEPAPAPAPGAAAPSQTK